MSVLEGGGTSDVPHLGVGDESNSILGGGG